VFPENKTPGLDEVEAALAADPSITDVAVVHCETTSGIVNPVQAIGRLARRFRCAYIVDAMSSFGAIPLDVRECRIDYLVSSANKCIEGVPGFSFVIARKDCLAAAEGYARSVSLDLRAQWREMETTGQFRFTPPTHALLAFYQALRELEAEGGVAGRAARYRRNQHILVAGMRALGFREYLRPEDQGPIITSFFYPEHPRFAFGDFYARLNEKGFVIYPGKVSDADCFRIGTIGRIAEPDVRALLGAIRDTLDDMQVSL
jgi:2-aminoethylphosphonate-pyruvate transaminase